MWTAAPMRSRYVEQIAAWLPGACSRWAASFSRARDRPSCASCASSASTFSSTRNGTTFRKTVAHAVRAAAELDVRYVTVHASGGLEMLQAAQAAVKGSRTEILAVTVLTSLDDGALRQIGFDRTAADQVVRLARLAVMAGVPGLVCSPHEIELIRQQVQRPGDARHAGRALGLRRTCRTRSGLSPLPRRLSAARIISSSADRSRRRLIRSPRRKALMAECGLS